ncbi:MAG: GDP-mannose 4,6-dehydratase [Desulfobacteraceae bacterium]|jgi:NAD dependent epimerase/dehydratase
MSDWNGRKVLVTGAGGFIGSHLCERLVVEGAEVRAFLHYNSLNHWGNLELLAPDLLAQVDIVRGDLTDPFSVERAMGGCQVVFHLGSLIAIPYSYMAPWQYVSTNVQGTVNVLEACRKHGIEKIVHTSTSEVYGTARYTPMDEEHPLQAQSPYSASKISADKMAESYQRSYDLPVAVARPFNAYGPRQSARAVIPTIISQALQQEEVRLGSIDPVRDLTFVEDTVKGFMAVAGSEDSTGEVVNLGSGKGVRIGELAGMILELMGREQVPVVSEEDRKRPETSEVYELVCDNQKALNLCEWEPKVDLKEGLGRTIDWVKEHIHLIKAHLYNV